MKGTWLRTVSLFLLPVFFVCGLPVASFAQTQAEKPVDFWDKQQTPAPTPTKVPPAQTPTPKTPKALTGTAKTVQPSPLTTTASPSAAVQPLSLTQTAAAQVPVSVTTTAALSAAGPSSVTPTASTATGTTLTAKAPPPQLKPGNKSPELAFGIALIPGFLVHGAGHYYASRPVEGTTCLFLEGASFYMFYRTWLIVEPYTKDDNKIDANPSMNTGQINAALAMTAGGLLLFMGTWFYDMVGSPMACVEFNKKNQSGLVLDTRTGTQDPTLALHWQNKF